MSDSTEIADRPEFEKKYAQVVPAEDTVVTMRIHALLILIMAIVFGAHFWFVNHLMSAYEVYSSGVYILNPALIHRVTLYSTAEQLTGLRNQLSTRIAHHNAFMSTNLDHFTSVLSTITTDAAMALDCLQFVDKFSSLGAGLTAEELQEDADILVKEVEKLRSMDVSADLDTMLANITQIARTLIAEMTDMEFFVQDTSKAANFLLNRLGKTVYDIYAPANEMNAPLAGAVDDQNSQWSWDEIDEQGVTRRSIGEFSDSQQILLKTFFDTISQNEISTIVIPSVIRYGLGFPDTFPQELGEFGFHNFKTAIEKVSLLNPDDSVYHCEIVAHFGAVPAQVGVNVDFGNSPIKPESQFLGIQSMICGYDEEEKKDVVRERD